MKTFKKRKKNKLKKALILNENKIPICCIAITIYNLTLGLDLTLLVVFCRTFQVITLFSINIFIFTISAYIMQRIVEQNTDLEQQNKIMSQEFFRILPE